MHVRAGTRFKPRPCFRMNFQSHTLAIAGQLRDLLGESRSAYMTGGGLGRSGMSETDMDQLGRHTLNVYSEAFD